MLLLLFALVAMSIYTQHLPMKQHSAFGAAPKFHILVNLGSEKWGDHHSPRLDKSPPDFSFSDSTLFARDLKPNVWYATS
mmetsp:Transcript_4474/g.8543  ORF Transcript_4474/g.8543 Transcript_4474/m.8543 type:complete len:80 (+) Transcript_4474:209-448(+)